MEQRLQSSCKSLVELIVLRCCDETGAKLFMPTDVSRLKNELGTDLLDKLMGAVGSSDSEEEEDGYRQSQKLGRQLVKELKLTAICCFNCS